MGRTKAFHEEEVLDKAMELFWQKGYNTTSIQNLVDHLCINRASLYNTYGGKEALFDRAFLKYRQTSLQFVQSLFHENYNVREGLRKLLMTTVQQVESSATCTGCFVVNTTAELESDDEKLRGVLSEHKNTVVGMLQAYIEQGIERGQIPSDKNPRVLAAAIFTFHNGLQIIAKLRPEPVYLRSIIMSALELLDD